MTTPKTPDEKLRPYARGSEWDSYVLVCEHGSSYKASQATGKDDSNIRRAVRNLLRRAAQQGYAPPDITHEVPDGLTLKGTSIRYDGDGKIQQYWNKTKTQGRPVEETTELLPPKRIVKVSKLYDNQGQVIQEWVSEKPGDEHHQAMWKAFAAELAADLPRSPPAELTSLDRDQDLLACFPIGDHHLGMLAWKKETQSDSYDLELSEDLLMKSVDRLVGKTDASDNALIAVLGDFMHYDSFEAVTPTNRNLLDADGRYPKMVRAAVRLLRYVIRAVLQKHLNVHVIFEIGNHDLSSAIFIMECLNVLYEDDPRVTIDTSPSHYHYYEFGKNLIGTHHGHGAKLDKLPNIMAADRAEAWGRTEHRYWWTGHIHQKSVLDFAGCSVESFRILAPVDAWAANQGYRPIREMQAIMLHKEHGEVSRYRVNPKMFRSAADVSPVLTAKPKR